MGKQKWQLEAESYLRQILGLLQTYEYVGNIEQRSNKIECFEIFCEAYRAGYCVPRYSKKDMGVLCKSQRPIICGQTILDYAKREGWVYSDVDGEREADENERRYQIIETVRYWWDEWTYAWDHAPLRRRYKRKTSQLGISQRGNSTVGQGQFLEASVSVGE
ncbi:hypothetical protein LBMAG52_37150 [Planctomycetia bacterium]|nr:hypothetical protein LBMAG52_37150 [Planctomycetia bacterium]